MLSDDERRSLEEIERSFETEAREPPAAGSAPSVRNGRHRDGRRLLGVMGGVSVALLLAGVPAAALAVFAATLLGWLSWCVVSRPADAERIARSLLGGGRVVGSHPVQREWVRRYLERLSEAE